MKSYLIDTSVIINYLRDKGSTVKTLDNLEGELCSSYVCLAELYEGIFRVKEPEKAEKTVMDFFAGLSQTFSLDHEIAKTFGQLRADLKKQGSIIEDLDLLLAATCIAHKLTLITANSKHFSKITDLVVLPVN